MEIDRSELKNRWVQECMKVNKESGKEINKEESLKIKARIQREMEREKRYEFEYQRAKKAFKRDLSPKEQNILKDLVKQEIREEQQERRKKAQRKKIAGIVAATGIIVLGGTAIVNQINTAQRISETNRVKAQTKGTTETPKVISANNKQVEESFPKPEENSVLTYFSEEYNKQFPEANLSEEDLGVIGKTFNRFYIVDLDEQDNILRYSQDTNIASGDQLTENQDFLLEGDYGVRDLGKNYVVVNKNNNRIIAPAIGKIELQGKQDSEMILIDTGSVRLSSSGKEYIPGDSVMQLPEDQEKLKELYDQLEDKCREIEEEKNKEQTRGETLENDDYEH